MTLSGRRDLFQIGSMKTFFILVKFFSLAILTRGENEFCCNDGKTSITQEKVGILRKRKEHRVTICFACFTDCCRSAHMVFIQIIFFHLIRNKRDRQNGPTHCHFMFHSNQIKHCNRILPIIFPAKYP